MRSSIVCLIVVLVSVNLLGQNILVLEKYNKAKNIKFRPKDRISLIITPEDEKIEGRISYISDSAIFLENRLAGIALADIRYIRTRLWGFGFLRELLIKAGIGYAIVGLANQTFSKEQNGLFKYPLVIGSGLIATGLILSPLVFRKHQIENGKWRLIILDFDR